MVGGYREIEEGSNVTLVCTTYNVTRLTSEPHWRYGTKSERFNKLTEYNAPKGKTALRHQLDHQVFSAHHASQKDNLKLTY